MNKLQEQAIQFVMEFYNISNDVACDLYWDEVEAYMRLLEKGIGMKYKHVVYQVEWGGDVDGTGPERWRGMELGRFDTEDEAWAFVDQYHEYCEIDTEIE